MKTILELKEDLSPMAVAAVELRNAGNDAVTVPMIAGKCRMNDRAVLQRLTRVHRELRDAYPKITSHLVTRTYLDVDEFGGMPDWRKFNNYRVPGISDSEIAAVEVAKIYLPIGHKAYGIRFVPDKRDFLCRVWEHFFLNQVATGLLAKRVRSVAQAAENKCLSPREAAANIVGAVLAIGPAINGSKQLPSELKQIKQKAEGLFEGAWEKNFNKKQKDAWRL